ncbi:KI16B-like protein [Mya arenaria]|uniref:KI16B-like protein n=1 Tax=Mya arenaria TaxID=6604 RepID=A0ABY7FD95_MYAAR|nr:KI16B-like protein [Mya arenaria]
MSWTPCPSDAPVKLSWTPCRSDDPAKLSWTPCPSEAPRSSRGHHVHLTPLRSCRRQHFHLTSLRSCGRHLVRLTPLEAVVATISIEVDLNSNFIIEMHGKKTTITNTKLAEEKLDGVSETTREAMRVKDFTFDFSFWTVDRLDTERYHDQQTVYNGLGVDVVDSAYEGYNACDDVGLIPRICQELFIRMTDETTSYRTEVSYLEIYNEKVRDLLKGNLSDHVVHNLRVREHPKDGPYVQGLSKYIVNSYTEIEGLMQKGNSVRTTASTNMNDVSSRSHAIFTIIFTQATIKSGIPSEKTSKVHLVDLAGSERATATGATGVRLREGGSINKSLVSLGTVIKQLAEASEKGQRAGKGTFIPYRDSVLTWLLKDSLGGNSRTIMITTISPAEVNYAETLSALRYANRAKNIINRPTVNEDKNVKIIRELREEIERLKTMIGGDIDSISAPMVKEKLHESEARMKVLTEEWSEKWKDIASILKEGKTRVGKSHAQPSVDIVIAGEEVKVEHCMIENVNNSVTLFPAPDALCSVNGNLATQPTKLTQGAVVVLGKTNMFRYNNPTEAAQMKEELKKSGMRLSLSRTTLISQSMGDLYRSSDNISGWELDSSHREEKERIEELRGQIRCLEDRYHAEEEERINQQVALEMELERRQGQLDRAQRDLERVQLEVIQGSEIDVLLSRLDERERDIQERARLTSETLHQKIEDLHLENECRKERTLGHITVLEDKCRLKDTEVKLLQDELAVKKQAAHEQDAEDQKVINVEQEQLDRMRKDFQVLFHSQLDGDKALKQKYTEVEQSEQKLQSEFACREGEMKSRWEHSVQDIAGENRDIEEAWADLRHQEDELNQLLETEGLTEGEREEAKTERDQLEEAKTLLKLEEQKVATRERKILDAIEVEMDRWEKYKGVELEKVEEMKDAIAKECGNQDLDRLSGKIHEKQTVISEMVEDLKHQETALREFEKDIEQRQKKYLEEKEELLVEKQKLHDTQCKAVIKFEKDIISINEDLEDLDTKLNDELKEIQEEREGMADSGIEAGDLDEHLQMIDVSDKDQQRIEEKKKELTELQAAVDRANEQLEEKVCHFDLARDNELDFIELEKDSLQERVRQDKINALVEQEVKRRMFEEKLEREQKRQLERDRERQERDEEIKHLKEAHHPGQILSADSEMDMPRRKSTGCSLNQELPGSIHISIPSYRIQAYGSDSHYEYEVKIVIGDDVWSIQRRYSKFREFHMALKSKIPEFYMRSVLEICMKIPSCPLHLSQNAFLSKQVICDFDPFFRKGLFETSKFINKRCMTDTCRFYNCKGKLCSFNNSHSMLLGVIHALFVFLLLYFGSKSVRPTDMHDVKYYDHIVNHLSNESGYIMMLHYVNVSLTVLISRTMIMPYSTYISSSKEANPTGIYRNMYYLLVYRRY